MTDEQPDIGADAAPDISQAGEAAAAVPEAAQAAAPEAVAAVGDVATVAPEAPAVAAVAAVAADVPAAPVDAPTPAAPDVAPEAVAAAAVAAGAVAAAPAPAPAPVVASAPPAPPADPGWSQYVPTASAAGAGPAPGYEYAGFWIRVFAYIIDYVIIGIVWGIIASVTVVIGMAVGLGTAGATVGSDGQLSSDQAAVILTVLTSAILVVALMSWLVHFFYFTLFWVKRGATFGQSALGIRIARESDGGPLSWGQAILRYIMLLVGFAIFYLGVIWVAFEPRKRGWHDMAAGTLAVRRR